MITKEQGKWLDHLTDTDAVVVIPWDPTVAVKFLYVKEQIQNLLGVEQLVEHRGASSLKISGQDEIDVYVPVSEENFNKVVSDLNILYGQPRSNYPLKRARFVTSVDGKHIDVFVINREDDSWKDSELFYNYLLDHPATLDLYRKLKENASGKSTKAYYTEKVEFINETLIKSKSGN